MSVGRTPWQKFPKEQIDIAETLHMDDLFREGLWLSGFSSDLLRALNDLTEGKTLEIADPHFRPPKALR
jgi:hypothetical protein